jgi:perosamine synthetase
VVPFYLHTVITTPFTFIASANAVLYVGARPVFVDIDPDTFNIDPAQIEAAITPRTKALLPVHLYGLLCDMPAITSLTEKYGLAVIEDACQAHGAAINGQRAGSFGTGCFSFYPTKNITTAEGGVITTDDDNVADRARLLRSHGMRRRYYHESLGYNFRMTEIHAAIGLAQLPKLETFNEQRIANAHYLSARLRHVITPQVPADFHHVFHQYTIRVPGDRDALAEGLRQWGVGTSIYYPLPIHQQTFYRHMGYDGHFPIAEQMSREVLSLPVHPALTKEDLDTIVQAVNELT